MTDLRLYRLAFLPAALAVVAMMFSLEGRTDPLEPAIAPTSFDGQRAAATARQVVAAAPEREPGSAGDAEAADLVAGRFEEVRAGSVSEQTFEGSYAGEEAELRNVLLTLPGNADSAVVVLAPRNAADGPGAATTAAATGVLAELGNALGVAGHEKTFVLASTPGDTASATGALELVDGLPERGAVEAVVVISQPGATTPQPPHVVDSSSSEAGPSIQLRRTAALAVSSQAGRAPDEPSALAELSRLAIPSGLGAQAPLIADGFDAVAISSAGERPLPPSADQPDDLSAETLTRFGRAVQATVSAIDAATTSLEHGPGAYIGVAGNLVPGWTLALLGLALLLPAAVAAIDGCARAARRGQPVARALGWGAVWALPFLGALLALYGLALVGVIPQPGFPFDPAQEPTGVRAVLAIALLLAAAGASAALMRRLGARSDPPAEVAAVALGAVAAAASLLVWFANPYLGLLIAPAAHVWMLAEGSAGGRSRALAVAVAAVAALAPIAIAVGSASNALELGIDTPWFLVLIVAEGQIGFGSTAPTCFVAGALAGALALSVSSARHGAGHPAGA